LGLGVSPSGATAVIGHWALVNSIIIILPLLPLLSHLPFPMLYALCPMPNSQLKDILKTIVANYALDKLKIEIAGNSNPAYPHLFSGTD
jgi:hypothetical protein